MKFIVDGYIPKENLDDLPHENLGTGDLEDYAYYMHDLPPEDPYLKMTVTVEIEE